VTDLDLDTTDAGTVIWEVDFRQPNGPTAVVGIHARPARSSTYQATEVEQSCRVLPIAPSTDDARCRSLSARPRRNLLGLGKQDVGKVERVRMHHDVNEAIGP
jgi:hypothetical protein